MILNSNSLISLRVCLTFFIISLISDRIGPLSVPLVKTNKALFEWVLLKPKPKLSPQPITGKKNITRSQWELEKKRKLPKARKNAGDQVGIGVGFASNWLREWPQFSGPIKIALMIHTYPMCWGMTADVRRLLTFQLWCWLGFSLSLRPFQLSHRHAATKQTTHKSKPAANLKVH